MLALAQELMKLPYWVIEMLGLRCEGWNTELALKLIKRADTRQGLGNLTTCLAKDWRNLLQRFNYLRNLVSSCFISPDFVNIWTAVVYIVLCLLQERLVTGYMLAGKLI